MGKHRATTAHIVGFIATKNPTLALPVTVQSLFDGSANEVLVIDDGSDSPDSKEIFELAEKAGARVMHLAKNGGKSAALREGYLSLPEDESILIVQSDDDTIAGDLRIPAAMIARGGVDIIDIRVETFDGQNLVGCVQQLDYWLINAVIKRFQDLLRARLWLSGASVMYTYAAARTMLIPEAHTQTEDTEGRFRSVSAGLKLRYCSSRKAEFKTMIPETPKEVRKQWKRWALGNGQVIRLLGLGGGSWWIALVNFLSWVEMLSLPVAQFFIGRWVRIEFIPTMPHIPGIGGVLASILTTVLWMIACGAVIGFAGAIALRRWVLALVGVFIPVMSLLWAVQSVEGLLMAQRHRSAEHLSWTPPKRMDVSA